MASDAENAGFCPAGLAHTMTQVPGLGESIPMTNSRGRNNALPLYVVLIVAALLAVLVQVLAVVLRGERVAAAGTLDALKLAAWAVLVTVFCLYLGFAIPSRGRVRETRLLSARYPDAVVVSTSVGVDRREALLTVGHVSGRLPLPVEMRVVLTPTSLSFWRGDLDKPRVDIRSESITYEMRDYFTIAGKFGSLVASVRHRESVVDIPLFPVDTNNQFLPKPLSRDELVGLAESLNRRKS